MPPNLALEGRDSEDWMVLDMGKIILHFFTPEMRLEMDLDGFWEEDAFMTEDVYHSGESTKTRLRGV